MGWDDVSVSLFGALDDGRLMQWITGASVKPYLDELQHYVPFGEPDGRRGADKMTIVRLCVESEEVKDGKFTRDRPIRYTTFTTAERYARAVGLIIRENSYDGCLLHKPLLEYSEKCHIVLDLIRLVRQESSSTRRGRFNPEKTRPEGIEIEPARAPLPSAEVLNRERAQIILNEQIVLPRPFKVQMDNYQNRPRQWSSLPADEREFRQIIKLHEGYLSALEKKIVENLDLAGASSIDKDFGPRTKARIFENLQEDVLFEEFQSISSELVIYGILRASQQRELDTMQKAHEYFGIYANKGPQYTECLAMLNISDGERPWLPGTSPTCVLFPFQIQGIAWLFQMVLSPIHGAILGDDMGLGKTFQACGLIQALVNARAKEDNPVFKYGKAKISLVVVPPIVLSAWQDVLESSFPALTVKMYGPGTPFLTADDLPKGESAASFVVVSTYAIMERHSLRAKDTWQENNGEKAWPQSLAGWIGTLILDEAQNVKKAQHSVRWSALKLLQAERTVCMTGTLFDNGVDDISGPLGLISRDDLWTRLKTHIRENPFEFDSKDERAALQCTTAALDGWIKRYKDPVTKGLWLQKMLNQLMRKTTYETVFRGRKIGESIPPMREIVIELSHDPEVLAAYREVAQNLGKRLITIEEGAHGQLVARFHMDIHRTLTVINLWHPLELVSRSWHTKRVQEFRASNGDLRAFLLIMVNESGYQWSGPKPLHNCTNDELVCEIAKMSTMIRFTLSLIRNTVVILRRKLLMWCDYPLSQLFVELVIEAVGVSAASLHSGLKAKNRNDVIRTFNIPSSLLQVLVMSTLVGNVGINLQHACCDQVMLGTTASDPQERQCLARIHRFGQTKEVTAWKPVTKDSYGEEQRLKRFLKVVADLVAHLDVDKLKGDGNIGRFSLEYDIGKEIEILWQELHGTVGMPQATSWLRQPEIFSVEGNEE